MRTSIDVELSWAVRLKRGWNVWTEPANAASPQEQGGCSQYREPGNFVQAQGGEKRSGEGSLSGQCHPRLIHVPRQFPRNL